MPHIPSAPTAELSILPFAEAMARSGQSGGYDAEKWLYVPDFYTEYRYLLGTRGEKPLVCIGINPSTAEPDRLDPTLQSVERVAKNNGYDSFLMFNVYAQRATSPDDMEKVCNPLLHEENLKAFRYVLSLSEHPVVWAAWGTLIEKRDYLPGLMREMVALTREREIPWVTFGRRSKKGHPHHPLYLRKDEKLRPFDVKAYLEQL